MLTIIEGVDGTGKTTLAGKISEQHDAMYLHAGPPQHEDWVREYVDPLLRFPYGWDIVCDRWALGELVWPKLFNRQGLFKRAADLDACLRACREVAGGEMRLIIVKRDPAGITETLTARGEAGELPLVLKAQDMFLDAAKYIHCVDVEIVDSDRVHSGKWQY